MQVNIFGKKLWEEEIIAPNLLVFQFGMPIMIINLLSAIGHNIVSEGGLHLLLNNIMVTLPYVVMELIWIIIPERKLFK
jgi:hypothetical protein